MRMFINIRNKGNMEAYQRVSKRNYGSRLGYSIEDTILEKRLVFDNSLATGIHIFHAITYFQA